MAPAGPRANPRDREIGEVLSVSPAGFLTVRAPGPAVPPEGSFVIDRSGREIGRVARIFGPVARPYLSVRPKTPLRAVEAAQIVGSTVRRG